MSVKKALQVQIDQKRIWKDAKDAAGPRYTSDINVELPIKDVFDGIGRTEKIFEEVEGYRKSLRESYKRLGYLKPLKYKDTTVRRNLRKIQKLGEDYLGIAEKFAQDQSKEIDLKSVIQASEKIYKYFSPIQHYVWDFESKEDDTQRAKAKAEGKEYFGHSSSEDLRELKSLESTLREFESSIRSLAYFAKSHKAQLMNDPFLLILGQAGMGKTHLVCDISKKRLDDNLPPTIIVLGEKLLDINDSLGAIFKATSIKGTKSKILQELNNLGQKANRRSLIIIDAINEADRKGWKAGVRELIREAKKYPWIGVIMTCRIPFQFLYLPKRLKIVTEYHQGFQDNELEAMTAFFNFYGLTLPQVPLLISEFSSPLFLSCFCRTAKDIKGGKAKVTKGIKDLALGQVGMTKILEDFYITKEEWIIKKHSLKYKALIKHSWLWNKSGNDCLVKMIAKLMAGNGRRFLIESEVLGIIKDLSSTKYTRTTCLKVLKILIEEGVLIRDAAWDDKAKKYYDVLKFSFHKFSDHIIARNLLYDKNLFNSKKVKLSLKAPTSLGNLFKDEYTILINIDLVEALMVEFPESVKNNKSLHEKDLINFLPKELKYHPQIRSAFIQSLYWRKPVNFLNDKGEIKSSILEYINKIIFRYDNSYRELLDLFVSTATKPFHPLNAERLNKYLDGLTLTSRDLLWSEYLRKQYGSGSIYKLISWIENQKLEQMTPEQAVCVMQILKWVLGSNVKLLRNRATRCLYIVGKVNPEKFMEFLENSIQVNDPYIQERLLAVDYGIAIALRDLDKKLISKILYPHSKNIYALFFKKHAELSSSNVFIRDYARGVIEVGLYNNKNLFSNSQIKRIRPPYLDGGIRRWGRSEDKDEGLYRDGNAPLGWEFEKDTLRHLVGSRPYDNRDKNYIKLKENIMWRLYELGYSLKKFGDIDKNIERDSRRDRHHSYAGKIERYGEKYSLIAYREIMGIRLDRGQLEKWWVNDDGREESMELDVSFPQSSMSKSLYSKILTTGPKDIKKWMIQAEAPNIAHYLKVEAINDIKGPWILVEGTIGEKDIKNSRKIMTFLHGILVKPVDIKKLNDFFSNTDYPGNDSLPSLPETRDFFAGEISWREKSTPDPVLEIKIKRGEKQRKLTKEEKKWYGIRLSYSFFPQKENHIVKEAEEPPLFKTESIYEKVRIQRIARWFATKDYSYLGKDDDVVGMYIPSKKISKDYKLHFKTSSFNLSNEEEEIMAIPINRGDQYGTHENLLYLRKDLLEKIQKKTGKTFVLVSWGERRYWPENLDDIHRSDHADILKKNQNVYKQNFVYPFEE